jgi:hypothetical protein
MPKGFSKKDNTGADITKSGTNVTPRVMIAIPKGLDDRLKMLKDATHSPSKVAIIAIALGMLMTNMNLKMIDVDPEGSLDEDEEDADE